MKTLTIHDLAEIMHVNYRTLQNRVSANPGSMPPPVSIDGHGPLLWLEDVVEAWFRERQLPAQ